MKYKHSIYYILLVSLMMLKINCTMAQTPFTCEAVIKRKSNGVFKLKLVLKNTVNKKYVSTSNRFNSLYKSFSYSNCGFDSVDFTFNSDGIRRTSTIDTANGAPCMHDVGYYLALTNRKKKKVKYIFTYKASCDKKIYYVVRCATQEEKFYKCVIELKYNSTEKPDIRVIPIEQITW